MPKGSKNYSYEYLRDKWVTKHKELQGNLVKKHKDSFEWLANNTKQLALGSLAGITILTAPVASGNTGPLHKVVNQDQTLDPTAFVVTDLLKLLPNDVTPLTSEQEASISAVLSRDYGVQVKPDINGLRLNRTYGLIGREQHLARYPGDSMDQQVEADQSRRVYSEGMAPGLGAWGYFATSKSSMTQEDANREKYYVAVQTFLAPNFSERAPEYRDFFKYRKMLVVNPQNGRAVVADIADAGPAEWTGKHLGGSPEVMEYLQREDGKAVGGVLYFFIDDSNNNIPLGPINPIQNAL